MLLWFNPIWQLSTMQLLTELSPQQGGMGRKIEIKMQSPMGWDKDCLTEQYREITIIRKNNNTNETECTVSARKHWLQWPSLSCPPDPSVLRHYITVPCSKHPHLLLQPFPYIVSMTSIWVLTTHCLVQLTILAVTPPSFFWRGEKKKKQPI